MFTLMESVIISLVVLLLVIALFLNKVILEPVSNLTDHIKERFSFSENELKSDIDQDVATITTSSPEAFKLYTIASEYFDQRDYQKALEWLEKAIEVDPEFAYAYRTMGICSSNMGYWTKRREYFKKAMEFSHRVSLRERYLIEADYYSETDKRKAIEIFKKLLDIYPNDITGNINLFTIFK